MQTNIEPPTEELHHVWPWKTSPSVVRLAEADEVEDMMELMRDAADEQALFPMDEVKARAMLDRAFLRQGGIIGVIGPKGRIEAALYMLLAQPLYSESWHIEEVFQVVRRQYRRSGHAKALIEFAKRCSDDLGVPVLMGVLHNKRTEAKIRLYQRHLGPRVGAFFLYGHPGYGLTKKAD
jgi:GNAT superfamily N-acetyltransferase